MDYERPNGRATAEDVANLARRAGKLAGWAARTGFELTRKLPGVDTAERSLKQVERGLLSELRRRLDEVDDPYHAALTAASAMNRAVPGSRTVEATVTLIPARDHIEPLRAAMAELLNHSIGFGRERAREYLYAIILRQLTPDEARILSALSDGSPFPAIDVAERTSMGGTGRIVLRNASTVGKTAGVSLPDQVPGYVTRLIGLGLVELDEEVPALETQYEILLTDESIREVEKQVKRTKIIRRTIHISRLGAQFWQACDPSLG
ncbi:Abi-alpha family protein [Amycolatopsis jejuensis]|uniref:Abi-alpha family protein n=1 Tax=Amycolatopsis jejuensis TaxID=330084 RepID=UPI000524ADCA|nr:Abi-alpha family protein [Amycolatopsis jejuensis]